MSLLLNSAPLMGYNGSNVWRMSQYETSFKPNLVGLDMPTYHVVLKEGDGEFIAKCRELQGVITNGQSQEEAMKRICIAIEEMLQTLGQPSKNFNIRPILNI